MRLMLRFTIPVEKGNEAEADGSLSEAIKGLIDQVQPEAAYFHLQDGKRSGTIFFEESDQARMAVINEPLFAKLNAAIDIQPAVSLEELIGKL
jgi:hypothetical protein